MVGPSPPQRKQPPVKSAKRRSFSYRRSKTPPEQRLKTEQQRSVSAYLNATNARIQKAKQKKKNQEALSKPQNKKRPPVKWVDRSHLSYTRDNDYVPKKEIQSLESPHFPCWNVLRFPEALPSEMPCSLDRMTIPSALPDRSLQSVYSKTISKNASTRYSPEMHRILFPDSSGRYAPPPLLQRWNQELAAVTQYIQLTPEEMQLRHTFIERLEQRFLAVHQKRAQVFGSFATTPICTFQSDLDLALWDAVTTSVAAPAIATEVSVTREDHRTSIEASSAQGQPPLKIPKELLLVEKWKLALAAAEETSTAPTAPPSSSSSDVVEDAATSEKAKKDQMIQKYKWPVLDSIDLTNEGDDNADATDGITLDYCGAEEAPENDIDDDSDHDSADPMTSYGGRRTSQHSTIALSESHLDHSIHVSWYASSKPNITLPAPPPPQQHKVTWNNHHPMPAYRKAQVVETLSNLCSSLRKKTHRRDMAIQHITLIKTAKVPIIKIETTHGFPVDIAVGGFGTDTSLYAQKQMARYPYSFVPVVIVLKTLLAQHRLDEPYTGGLGSYKLYILVAHHIHMHLQQQNDAEDREHYPFIMLYTFLYRYGYGQEDEQRSWKRRKVSENSTSEWTYPTTPLCQYIPFNAQDGIGSCTCADLSNVYKLKECLSLFRTCFQRLNDQMHNALSEPTDDPTSARPSTSLLAHLICPWKLQQDREQVLAKTKWSTMSEMTRQPPTQNRGNSTRDPRERSNSKQSNALEQLEDRTLEEIVAGYGIRVEDLTSP